ncbi:MAG: hypothetical protein LBC27_02665 [Spirochaetaceae bacterium]|jgi:hypothetical protein|nr:hypothetical protein [Spirochaetaceae bacterium]
MKTTKLLSKMAIAAALCLCASCEKDAALQTEYHVKLPNLPETWRGVLGEASWHIEWVGEGGVINSAETAAGNETPVITIIQGWTTPVTAWPYWPEKNIRRGIIKPAGALFPLDTSGGTLKLSWNGGVDAVFFWELAAYDNEKRLPYNFNWPRFRELFTNANLPEDVLRDPWLANWKEIAAKTASSGFDRRRISGEKRSNYNINIPANGPWIGVSPFAAAADWRKGETAVVKLNGQTETYFCPAGILRCSSATSIWIDYESNQ